MQLRYVHARLVTFAAPALLGVLLFLTPFPAAGQWMPAIAELVALVAPPTPASEVMREHAGLPLGSLRASPDGVSLAVPSLSASTYSLPLVLEKESSRRRMTRYIMAGGVLGGVAGYVIYDNFRRIPTDEDWGVGYIVATLWGVGLGALAGDLVGYIVERG